ncbi:uncharacterized protein LOC130645843 isoform X2 [Hydractinia symbiolongicarpus]|uniref:uncharacterized protein LOC130645843 isoform X2 n=1 Tax=Hydractinia symbiolongicarpus TaxID=13093 RepID=UPI00254EC5F1|nr:uncharacterized protein LOC130645843 isoform X2 [Hydractinia symbiolongicarpus]
MNLNQENKIGKQACEDNAKDTIPFSRNNDEPASKTKHTLTNAGINVHVSSSLDGKDTNLINMEKNNDIVHSNENMTCEIIESKQMNKNFKNQVLDICSDRVEAATECKIDETSNLKTPQKYFGEYFTARTYEEFQTLLENYFERTGTRFTVCKRSKYFGRSSTECDFSNHKVTWHEKENPLNPIVSFDMPYNGIPRINVGDFYLQCQFGSDFGASKKLKREKQEKLRDQIGEGKDIKRRSLKIPTKKCGCPAKMSVKQVGTFPEYKIPINSEFRRRTAAVKLRKQLILDPSSVHCEMYILGRFPDMSEHKNHGVFEGHEHDKEMIDKDIVLKIQQLHMQNLTISAIIKSCEDFVLNQIFYKQKPPERKRRKYFPKSKDIRNIVTRMRILCHCSEEQEKRISDFIEQAKGENEYLNACFDVKYQDSQEVDAESSDDEFFEPDSNGKKNKRKKKPKKPESKKQTFLFCCQTQKQQRLLKRYGGIVFVVRVENKSRAAPFHMYNILVQTNVDYQTVCSMIVSRDNQDGVKDGMTLLKEWNTYWSPKYFVVDSVKEIYNVVDDLFPASYFLNPQSCEDKWMNFLNTPSNELADQAEEVMAFLRNMAYSTTEDSLTIAAALFEGSSAWNNSSKLRTWFQTTWLHMAKKWVFGYRPEDLLITNHWKVSPNECVKKYEQALVEVTHTKYWLETVIKSVCTKISEDDYKEYVNRNKELYLTSKEFYRDNPISSCYQGVPMAILPHVYDVGVISQQNKFEISDNQLGLFTVKYEPEFVDVTGDERLETTADQPGKESGTSPKADATIDGQIEELSKDVLQSGEFTVSFGDLWNYPFCTCSYWQMYKLPCVHMFAVFCEVPDWKYDMLAPLYRFANVLHFDYSCVDTEIDNKSSSSDACCQTTILSQSVEIQKDLNEENLFIRPPSVDKNFLHQCNEFLLHFDKLAILFKDKKLYKTLRHELQSLRNDLLSNAVSKKNPFEVLTVKHDLSNEIKYSSSHVSPECVTKVKKSTYSATQMKVAANKKNVTVVKVAEGDDVNSVLDALAQENPRKSFKVYREDAAIELLSENSAVTKLKSETLTHRISEVTPILSKVSTRSAERNLKRTVIVVKAADKASKKESAGCLSNVPRKLQPTVLKKTTKMSTKRTTKGIVNEKSECSFATCASSINRSLTEDTTVKNPTIAKDVGPLLGVCTSPVSSSIVSNTKSHTFRTLAVMLDAHSSIPITLEKSKPRPSKNYPRSVVIVKSKSQSGHVSDQQDTEKRNLSPKRKSVSVTDYLPNFKKKCPDI